MVDSKGEVSVKAALQASGVLEIASIIISEHHVLDMHNVVHCGFTI